MKTNRKYPKVIINKKAEKRQEKKHPWVYDNEIISYDVYENGEWKPQEIIITENFAWNAIGYNTNEKVHFA
mgnify:CR=1 FL=1